MGFAFGAFLWERQRCPRNTQSFHLLPPSPSCGLPGPSIFPSSPSAVLCSSCAPVPRAIFNPACVGTSTTLPHLCQGVLRRRTGVVPEDPSWRYRRLRGKTQGRAGGAFGEGSWFVPSVHNDNVVDRRVGLAEAGETDADDHCGGVCGCRGWTRRCWTGSERCLAAGDVGLRGCWRLFGALQGLPERGAEPHCGGDVDHGSSHGLAGFGTRVESLQREGFSGQRLLTSPSRPHIPHVKLSQQSHPGRCSTSP